MRILDQDTQDIIAESVMSDGIEDLLDGFTVSDNEIRIYTTDGQYFVYSLTEAGQLRDVNGNLEYTPDAQGEDIGS